MAKPAEMDYYKVLGLVPGASKEEVASAYRKRSMAVHPDRYKGDNPEAATAEFINLTTAKEVLLDDKARAAFEALSRARDAHRAKQETQHAGRKKMREELEEREQAAKRRRQEPSAEQLLRQQREAEADARRDLEHELERLRSSGRLDGDAKQRPEPAATAVDPRVVAGAEPAAWPALPASASARPADPAAQGRRTAAGPSTSRAPPPQRAAAPAPARPRLSEWAPPCRRPAHPHSQRRRPLRRRAPVLLRACRRQRPAARRARAVAA